MRPPHRKHRGGSEHDQSAEELTARARRRALETPIAELDIPPRVASAMEAAGLFLIGDVLTLARDDLAGIKNAGGQAVLALGAAARALGLEPLPDWAPPVKPPRRTRRGTSKRGRRKR